MCAYKSLLLIFSMPRSLVLGNGNLLVSFDRTSQVRDVYYPHIGQENHVGENLKHRVGVWVDGELSWLDSGAWRIALDCNCETLVGLTTAVNDTLGIRLFFTDVVYNEKNIFIRRLLVKNMRDEKRVIKVFFGHEFRIAESHVANTALYNPIEHTLIHYRGRRVFLINAIHGNSFFDEYTTGVFGIEGKEGSYKDAEDGRLSRNPIEHGPTDSILSIIEEYEPHEEKTMHYWFAAGTSIDEVQALNAYVIKKTPDHLIKTTKDFWYAWVNKQETDYSGLSEPVVELFKKSLFFVRAHADNHGAIIASTDSDMLQKGKDTYNYMWPRDGAFVALALDKAGDINVAERFYRFCNDVISHDGYFMHKYTPDKALGSSWHPWIQSGLIQPPIQEDETALVIFTLWQHYQTSRNLEFIEEVYNSLIKKAADFMVSLYDAKTNLPYPTYDLWEEKFGIHTFTAAAVYGGLHAAGNFAQLLGKKDDAERYLVIAEVIKRGVLRQLYDEERGVFIKGLALEKWGGKTHKDMTVDSSSVYGVFAFGLLKPGDPKLDRAMRTTREILQVDTSVGGVARYEGDAYYAVSGDVAGNPWFITTLWFTQYEIARAETLHELEEAHKTLGWVVRHATASGILSEQLHPYSGEQLSAAPLTWSHAEYVRTVIAYIEKLGEFEMKDKDLDENGA